MSDPWSVPPSRRQVPVSVERPGNREGDEWFGGLVRTDFSRPSLGSRPGENSPAEGSVLWTRMDEDRGRGTVSGVPFTTDLRVSGSSWGPYVVLDSRPPRGP